MQLAAAVAEKADLSNAEAKRVLAALEDVVLDEISNAQKVRIGGLVQLTPRMKSATKKRPGRNPATGAEITIAAKPASVDLRARPLAKAKHALPSVQKARRRLPTQPPRPRALPHPWIVRRVGVRRRATVIDGCAAQFVVPRLVAVDLA